MMAELVILNYMPLHLLDDSVVRRYMANFHLGDEAVVAMSYRLENAVVRELQEFFAGVEWVSLLLCKWTIFGFSVPGLAA
jgi:hypothetical protein